MLASLCAVACGGGQQEGEGAHTAAVAAPSSDGVVDSIFPMPVMLARFQAEAGPRPAGLGTRASTSRDELVARFVDAVQDSSVSALRELRLDMAEYVYLYFPDSHMSREPYRQPPSIGWMLTEQNGMKGEARVLREYGGRPLGFEGYTCPAEPAIEGANTLWRDCTVRLARRTGPIRLFGTIIERAGRYRFVSIANDL